MRQVSVYYINGIRDARAVFEVEGMVNALEHLENLKATIKGFAAGSPVGQYLRGERDFWANQLKKA